MIGNDIVDLKLASIQSNWQRKGFLNKVFTENEQHLILHAANSFKMVWRLWSMKESAYKIYVQQYQKRFFAPKKLECFLINTTEGFVVINHIKYITASTIENGYIYTTARLSKAKNDVINTCFSIEDTSAKNQRAVTYHQLKTTISKAHKLPYQQLKIKKTAAGIPKIYQHNQPLNIPFSITHHGTFGAISLLN